MNKKGFTLVEVLVGISISVILMISVGILVSGGISNIINQEKIFKNSDDFLVLETKLNTIFSNIDTSFSGIIINSPNKKGVILKINNQFNEGGFAYIGTTNSPINNGNGIYCGSGSEDINTKHVFIKTFIPYEESSEDIFSNFDEILTGNTIGYTSHSKDNVVKDNSGDIIIGKEIFGDKLESGASGKDVYLNNPTGLARNNNILFISDTLNNRVLYYNITNDQTFELLNENDGLKEPTGLYYDSSDNALYISNSGKREVLKYYSENIITPELSLTGITANNITDFNIDLYSNSGEKIIMNRGIIDIEGHTITSGDTYTNSTNRLSFSFSGLTNHNFSNNYIKINNISDFSGTGTYYAKLDINNKIFPFFSQSDNDILTKDDNKLEVYDSNLDYETGFNSSMDNRNNFIDNIYNNLEYNKNYDYILKVPIKDIDIEYSTTNRFLNLNLKYYKKYNCYDLDDKRERTFLIKKNFK